MIDVRDLLSCSEDSFRFPPLVLLPSFPDYFLLSAWLVEGWGDVEIRKHIRDVGFYSWIISSSYLLTTNRMPDSVWHPEPGNYVSRTPVLRGYASSVCFLYSQLAMRRLKGTALSGIVCFVCFVFNPFKACNRQQVFWLHCGEAEMKKKLELIRDKN